MTRVSFWVDGPLPGMNEVVAAAKSGRGRGNAYARQKAVWTNCVAVAAMAAGCKLVPSPVTVSCVWHESSARRDPDNVQAAVKFVLDGLVDAGVLRGDGRADIAAVRHEVVTSKTPGVAVTVEPMENEA